MRISAKDSKLTAAQVAAAVKRTVTEPDKDGKSTTKEVAVKAAEVFDWCVHDDTEPARLVVVTTDGQKLAGDAPAAKK